MGRIVAGADELGNFPGCPYDIRTCGAVECGTCYGPQNTLMIGFWDTAMDTTESQDEEILNGIEEILALQTNLYENVEHIWLVGGSRGGAAAITLMSKVVGRFKQTWRPRVIPSSGGYTYNHIFNDGVDELGISRNREELTFIVAGIPPVSTTVDRGVDQFVRVVSHPWGCVNRVGDPAFCPGGHGNGHNFLDLFHQNGSDDVWSASGRPTLHVISVEDDSGYDPMFHVGCDDGDCENDAELPVRVDYPYCIWDPEWYDAYGSVEWGYGHPADSGCRYWNDDDSEPDDLYAYAYPWRGPEITGYPNGRFFSMLFPLTNLAPWRRYEHDELTRDWTYFHTQLVNNMFRQMFGVNFNGGNADLPNTALCCSVPTGREFDCFDGLDNDGDGMRDQADPDCNWSLEGRSNRGSCEDGIDNDFNGRIDCRQSSCCIMSSCETSDYCSAWRSCTQRCDTLYPDLADERFSECVSTCE